MTNTYGYIRVSSTDQNEGRQLAALAEKTYPAETFTSTASPARISTARSTGGSWTGCAPVTCSLS